MKPVSREPLRPYSAQYWREMQRDYQLRQARRRSLVRLTGLLAAALFLLIVVFLGYRALPRSWRSIVIDTGDVAVTKIEKGFQRLKR